MSDQITVMQAFDRAVERNRDRVALRFKIDGQWHDQSWSEFQRDVHAAARSLIALGMTPGAGVSIIGFNCPPWVIAHWGAIHAGGRPAGIYTTNSAAQCRYVTEHCDAEVAFVEDQEQLAKFLSFRDHLPRLRAIVLMTGESQEDRVYAWRTFLELGSTVEPSLLDARIAAQHPDDVCSYIYTSGTTGDPKSVMLSHDNVTWTSATALGMVDFGPQPTLLSYLPLSHIAEQVLTLYGPCFTNATVAFAESMEKLPDNLREIRPTAFLGVPRVWEKIQAKIVEAGAKNPPIKKAIAKFARRIGLDTGYADQRNTSRPVLHPLAKKLVFDKVRRQLGLDRSTIQITSAAPIAKSTLEFFLSLGVPIMEVYGMSEGTGPITVSLPHQYKTGKLGRPITGSELRIAEDGEICIRGRGVFKGYLKDEAATRATIDADGWLHSGDIGRLDEDGFLEITDRKKDIIITAGGENIAPALIEGRLKAIPAVSHAIVIGDRRKFLAALLTLDPDKLAAVTEAAGSGATTIEEAAADPKVHDWLMRQVETMNHDLARVQAIKKIAILPSELSIDGGELTPTMKVKRKVITEKYGPVIERLYT